jgi:hypothetical protein
LRKDNKESKACEGFFPGLLQHPYIKEILIKQIGKQRDFKPVEHENAISLGGDSSVILPKHRVQKDHNR